MPRDLPHFYLRNFGTPFPFQAKGGGGSQKPSDVPNRVAHAQALLQALDALPNVLDANLPGVYLEFASRPHERLLRDRLNKSDLTLLRYDEGSISSNYQEHATVFATARGVENLRKKLEQFKTEDTADRKKNGETIPGRPKHADLVQSIAAITEAGLRALWRSPADRFPDDSDTATWEVWLEPSAVEFFCQRAPNYKVVIGEECLEFPEDTVVIANGNHEALASAIRHVGGVRALAAPTVTADFFDGMDVLEQSEWVDELLQRTEFPPHPSPGFITLFDTGISRAHPLLQPAIDSSDRHAANVAWGLEDIKGHGTQMAGLALYGDLTPKLHQSNTVIVSNKLESVKLIPDTGENYHHLYGSITCKAVDIVEQNASRRRIFAMAVTTSEDTPHDGAPTSWSSEIDQLASGVSGQLDKKRLFLISAGNTNNTSFGADNYLETCDSDDNEIESPAQAWNAIVVGAFTEKTSLPTNEAVSAVAPFGDLSPASRTASWSSTWPIKPDLVMEGGNWALSAFPPPMTHSWLSLLSTHNNYPRRSFTFTGDTSAATALAAKDINELWSEFPSFWPETIRGLYISSARWTSRMQSHLPPSPQKGDYALLFQRYGYGVPDLNRAKRSASNSLTLIVEDTITPYGLSEKTGGDIHNEMKFFTLPWPTEELRKLGNTQVTLRVTLSSFVAPNPSESSRGSKYRYASHNLRFKLNRADEKAEGFMARISKHAEKPDGPGSNEDDLWEFGSNRRDVGSLHIDQLTCRASDLARRNLIAVHPVTGWWKSKTLLQKELPEARFSLIIEINAEQIEADLYNEVRTKVEALVSAKSVIVT